MLCEIVLVGVLLVSVVPTVVVVNVMVNKKIPSGRKVVNIMEILTVA